LINQSNTTAAPCCIRIRCFLCVLRQLQMVIKAAARLIVGAGKVSARRFSVTSYIDYTGDAAGHRTNYTPCSETKHPLPISFRCRFKQKLQWIYPRNGRFWQCRNWIFIAADDV